MQWITIHADYSPNLVTMSAKYGVQLTAMQSHSSALKTKKWCNSFFGELIRCRVYMQVHSTLRPEQREGFLFTRSMIEAAFGSVSV
jgi:hypothetical protein